MAKRRARPTAKVQKYLRLKKRATAVFIEAAGVFDELVNELGVDNPCPLGKGREFVIEDKLKDGRIGKYVFANRYEGKERDAG